MDRLDVIRKFAEAAAQGIATPTLPALANLIRARCGRDLPVEYWKLALATTSYFHETAGVSPKTTEAARILHTYGNWAFDWAVRRHAVEIRRTSDVKRIADASGAKTEVEAAAYWRLTEYLLEGKGAANDRPPAAPVFLKICGGIAIVLGPDSIISICRELLDTAFERISVVSRDFKTTLQEETQRRFRVLPSYSEASSSGPDHSREFCWRATVGSFSAEGCGPSRKAAQQAAAQELLDQIGIRVSGPTTRASDAFHPTEQLSRPVALRVREAERILSYTFRNKGLLATALTHTSYVHENRRTLAPNTFSYDVLASLGSSSVWLLGAESYFQTVARDADPSVDLNELLGVAVKTDLVAGLAVTLELSNLLVTGKGQRQSITPRMRSEVMQAVLAAVILDSETWARGISAAQAIAEPFVQGLLALRPNDIERLNAKTVLQEYAQALGWQLAYALLSEAGPDHATSYTAQVVATIAGYRFKFAGDTSSSKGGSEADAAKIALGQISDAFRPRATDTSPRPHLNKLGAAVFKSIVNTLRLGIAGWRRVLSAQSLGLSRLLSTDPAEATTLLLHIHELASQENMLVELGSFSEFLALAPIKRDDVRPAIIDLAGKWFRHLELAEPDRLSSEQMRALVAEAKFLLSACGYLSGDDAEGTQIRDVLEALGMQVVSSDSPAVVSTRLADAIYAAIRFVSSVPTPRVRVSTTDGRLICSVRLSEADATRLETVRDVLRCLSIFATTSNDALVLDTPVPAITGWVGESLVKLRRGARSDLPLRYIAHHLHDMKNEITATLMNAAEARRDRVNRFRHLAAAEGCLERARATCREIERASREVTEIQVSSFALRPFLSEVVREAMVRAPSVAFSMFLDAADVNFEADRLMLRNAIENLLKNAIRAVRGGGDIRVESVFDTESRLVIVEFSNSGELASDSVIAALDKGTLPDSTAHIGVGFGLISVVRVAELYGGTFRLFNRAGRTYAVLELPSASN